MESNLALFENIQILIASLVIIACFPNLNIKYIKIPSHIVHVIKLLTKLCLKFSTGVTNIYFYFY